MNNRNFLSGDIHGGHARAGIVVEKEDGNLQLDESTFRVINSKENTDLDDVLTNSFDTVRDNFDGEIDGVSVSVASPVGGISNVLNPANTACLKAAVKEGGPCDLQAILQKRYETRSEVAAVLNDLQGEAAGLAGMGALGTPAPKHFILENGGTGYGGARTQNGRTNAAEPGHVKINSSGPFEPICGCGQTGCAEAYLGSDAVADRVIQVCRAKMIKIPEIDPNIFADQEAKKGTEWAVKHLREVANIWGGLWRDILQQFPGYEKILVTGSYLRAVIEIPDFLEEVRETLKESSFPEAFSNIPIEPAPMPGIDGHPVAPMIGAADLLRQHLDALKSE
ncbi:ROK family protein [Candidatus Peregrinibacteria bacterium]|jgi:predicted NBD/HSP70 family sugar kinase|nr:ROK family protein [Candidatus Peregrinibacteria bacterium]MBT3599052.1 ROK family protein [Candidatus Peregrinibacteria bacterium]MBT4367289.1 ROK family protein [Candidatus Peregrinibacteria bacterium]MBT4585600.1 ROK family protein [Candidatus Peregrinibacteria bacterium]MBT6730642.1 ROK family protein [Candidatus Peregrinibacteria bacterium]